MRTRLLRIPLLLVPFSGCGSSIHDLPPLPPVSASTVVQLDPAAEARDEKARFLEARGALLAFFDALHGRRWSDAYAALSNETRVLLDGYSGGRGEEALRTGRLTLDGVTWGFDPAHLFAVRSPSAFADEVRGEREEESEGRKEVFVTSADGEVRKVVLIREADGWRIHLPSFPTERLTGRVEAE